MYVLENKPCANNTQRARWIARRRRNEKKQKKSEGRRATIVLCSKLPHPIVFSFRRDMKYTRGKGKEARQEVRKDKKHALFYTRPRPRSSFALCAKSTKTIPTNTSNHAKNTAKESRRRRRRRHRCCCCLNIKSIDRLVNNALPPKGQDNARAIKKARPNKPTAEATHHPSSPPTNHHFVSQRVKSS